MYGLTHRGLRAMVIYAAGEHTWEEIEQSLGIGPSELITAVVYDDDLTTRMLVAASEALGISTEQCMIDFGRYWVRYVEKGPYAAIMQFTGDDLATFVTNLDRMHQAVLTSMPDARVPQFSVLEGDKGSLTVRYSSEREGLEQMVIGLFRGLLDRFSLNGTVEQIASTENRPVFRISYEPIAA